MSKSDTGRKARRNGAELEKRVARDLRAWLGDEWTVSRLKTSYQAGAGGEFEIAFSDPGGLLEHTGQVPIFPVAIECKRDARFKTDQLWKPGVGAFFRSAWSQAVEQAEAVGKRPWLVLREPPRGPVLLVMRWDDWPALRCVSEWPYPLLRLPDLGVVVLPWSAFLEAVPASALAELS